MGPSLSLSPSPKIFSLLFSYLAFSRILVSVSSSDHTSLIYKGCANQRFQDQTGIYSQTLRTLFGTLVSQSSSAKFFKTTAGSGDSSITGIFQCRGDLSNADCANCVGKIPNMVNRLCGETIAARVQLTGCYMRYEVYGFKQVSGTELLYKVCGSTRASGSGFGERLDLALGEVAKGVQNGKGFYTGGYQSIFVLGQCEGDLGTGDCVDCVKSAAERSKSECGSSISAQIYLQECYISYTYYPNGVPRNSPSDAGAGSVTAMETGRGKNTQKTVAIVVGGVAGLGLGIACLLVLKSAFKKKPVDKYGG